MECYVPPDKSTYTSLPIKGPCKKSHLHPEPCDRCSVGRIYFLAFDSGLGNKNCLKKSLEQKW